ncbi:MAG: hypothetical protein Pg6C_10630 [Treponemataceae bacterium]|nr:MAG: hypothetical protein Pg6C_10630 [Treponemataceae bacterium]
MIILRRIVLCGVALAALTMCSKGAQTPAPDTFLSDALKPVAAQGKLLWSPEAETADADKAASLIEQGKTHIKITGAVTTAQIEEISGALLKAANKDQLIRLDLSASSGLAELDRNAFRNRPNLGSIALPEGITFIERDAFLDATNLIEISLPDSLATVNGNSFNRTGLPRIVLPAKTEWNGFRFVSSKTSCAVIFKEGRASVKLSGFAPDSASKDTRLIFVLPSSLTEISEVDMDTGSFVSELYCYAPRPPAYNGTVAAFPNAKTVYVPANSVSGYKSAWQSLTSAEFKPLPAGKTEIAAWVSPPDIAEAFKAAGGK